MEFLKLFLLPLAIVYEWITRARNKLFDLKLLPSVSYNLPVISVGNLSAGGTGKTPHVEYIIRLLSGTFNLTTLSRGYGRETKGFRIAKEGDNSSTIGDEPMQFFTKFPQINVVLDADRRNGIKNIISQLPRTDAIVLDDAFQHRYVKPGLSILLTDFHKLFTNDYILPLGTLRESRKASKRANIIIVTKTPSVLSPYERERILNSIKPSPYQKVLFSYIKYGKMQSLWKDSEQEEPRDRYSVIMLVAGIANPYPLEHELRKICNDLITLRFNDHHKYTRRDFESIKRNFNDIYTRNKLLITTEKDAMRMLNPEVKDLAAELPIYYMPMEIDFHNGDKKIFDETLNEYVRKNKRER